MKRRFLLIIARLKKNYTADFMAEKLGITRNQYSNIENGHTQILKKQHIEKVATLLDIPTELIDTTEDKFIFNNSYVVLIQGENNTQTNNFSNDQLLKIIEQQQEAIKQQQDFIKQILNEMKQHYL